MIFRKVFFSSNLPTCYTVFKNRPVVFYTGLEKFTENGSYNKKFFKKYQDHFSNSNYLIISWIVRLDEIENKIQVLEKGIY